MIDKTYILAFAAGAVAGLVGASYYQKHKAEVDASLQSLRNRAQSFAGNPFHKEAAPAQEQAQGEAAAETAAQSSEVTLEELEAQKERLEDLIAEIKAKQQKPDEGAAAANA